MNKFTILGCGSSLGTPWITRYSSKLDLNEKKIIGLDAALTLITKTCPY